MGRLAAKRSRLRAQAERYALFAGERLIVNYSADMTGCACDAHTFAGIECRPVARKASSPGGRSGVDAPRLHGVDRCVQCGARWKRRDYRVDPLVMLQPAVPS